ncbi:helix-turn-helix domain-containing protein [Variovorax sp. J22R24]|uniref:GlxA family transcriptional regulator n=1 Tax=Variovorax gracilis TaxID=3053502 RepID=UPI0025773830|nr:helix-turn-helix domain-containing protein [Variovorax sp. J22R24]MDM0105818.1 helix-turn-helix domain-containing protein [Variovorax sp. J22R24]
MKVSILALDGVFDTGLATVQDVFSTANELAGMLDLDVARFDVSVVGMRRKVHTSQGLRVPVVSADEGGAADWMVVPAIGDKMPDALQTALKRRDVADAAQALRQHASRGGRVAAACIGTFVLAESALLDDQKATTTWWLASLFRQRYPEVRLDESRMLVSSGAFVTAGAALSHIDMALLLVRQASPELAALVAKYLIVDSRPSQSAYVITDHLSHSDPTVERFERWARGRLTDGFSLDEAAAAAGTSKRTLARRMHQVLGKSPLSYFQDLRVERAVHMLKTSDRSLEQIAELVGYADGVTLRSLLRQRIGRSVRDLRAST